MDYKTLFPEKDGNTSYFHLKENYTFYKALLYPKFLALE